DLVANLHNVLSAVASRENDHRRSADEAQMYVELAEEAYGPESLQVSEALQNLAIERRALKQLDTVIADSRRSVAIAEKLLGPHHPAVAIRRFNLAMAYGEVGRN